MKSLFKQVSSKILFLTFRYCGNCTIIGEIYLQSRWTELISKCTVYRHIICHYVILGWGKCIAQISWTYSYGIVANWCLRSLKHLILAYTLDLGQLSPCLFLICLHWNWNIISALTETGLYVYNQNEFIILYFCVWENMKERVTFFYL